MSRIDSTANATAMTPEVPFTIFRNHDDSIDSVDNLSQDVWSNWGASRINDGLSKNVVYLPGRTNERSAAADVLGEFTIEGLSALDGETVGRKFQHKLVDLLTELVIGVDMLQQTPEHLSPEQIRDFAAWMDQNMAETPDLIRQELQRRGASPTAFVVAQRITGEFSDAPGLIGTVGDGQSTSEDDDQTITFGNAPYVSTASSVL